MPYKNIEDAKACRRRFYHKNKKQMCKRSALFRIQAKARNKTFVKDYLLTHPCVDCGFTDIRALDFDHIKDVKINHISKMVNSCYSLDIIKKEIEKCQVRCANCHRIVTAERRLQQSSSVVERGAHNPEVDSSNLSSASII